MTHIAITVDNPAHLAGLARALAAYNERNSHLTEEAFLQKLVNGQLEGLAAAYVTTKLSRLAFLERFTADERVALRGAAQTNPQIGDWLGMLDMSDQVSLVDDFTIAGVQSLEAAGVIASGRAAEILVLS